MKRTAFGSGLVCAAALALAILARSARAQAQGCGDEGLEVRGDFELTPEDGAEGVARNAPIVVRFAQGVDLAELAAMLEGELAVEPPAPCAGELVCVLDTSGDDPRAIDAEPSIEDNVVRLVPRAPLAAHTEYTVLVVQPGLDLIARSDSAFETGDGSDREPPVLDYGSDDVTISVTELPPECGQPSGSRRVIVSLPPASDDGDRESVELEVVLTMAAGLGRPEVRARGPNEGDPVRLGFILSAQEAGSRVCLAVRATDAIDRRAEQEPTVCFNPSPRPVFESACGVALGRRENPGGAQAWLLVFWVALLRTARRWRPRTGPVRETEAARTLPR